MVLLTIQQLYRNKNIVVVLGYYGFEWEIPFDINGLRKQKCGEGTPFHANTLKTISHGNTGQT